MRLILISIALILIYSCKNKEMNDQQVSDLLDTTEFDNIKRTPKSKPVQKVFSHEASSKLAQAYGQNNCMKFKSNFPLDFESLNQIYGFDDKAGAMDLYEVANEHIDYLFSCVDKESEKEILRLFRIGVGGKWEADGISYFQNSLTTFITNNSIESLRAFKGLSNIDIKSLFYFLLDGPHPDNKENIEFLEQVTLLDSSLGKVINGVFSTMLKNHEH